jgi:sugar/nucleoside kinase (ribokinase family)
MTDPNQPSHVHPRTRADVCVAAADALEKIGSAGLSAAESLIGFDGFIDSIISVVDQRTDMGPKGYTKFATIDQFAVRVGAASGKSTNIELVVHEERFGGNGPLMAGALGRLGMGVTYIGCVGKPDSPRELNPIFKEFASRCSRVIPVSPPATTEALEFDDGKVMLGKTHNIQRVNWDLLCQLITLDELKRMVARAKLIGVVNWVMMGGVESIWDGLCREVFPSLPEPGRSPDGVVRPRRIFIDLCDPAKRTDGDISNALTLMKRMNRHLPVTLGLNLSEAERIASVLQLTVFESYEGSSRREVIRESAVQIREALGIAAVVVHPRHGAAAAFHEPGRSGSAWFDGPFTSKPKLSTGAGDHFNGGFALAQTLGLGIEECLAVGCATSGVYVRDALSPTLARLVEFLREMPPGESRDA